MAKQDNSKIYGYVQRGRLIESLLSWALTEVVYDGYQTEELGDEDIDVLDAILAKMSIASLMHPLAIKAALEKSNYKIAGKSVSPILTAYKREVAHQADFFDREKGFEDVLYGPGALL